MKLWKRDRCCCIFKIRTGCSLLLAIDIIYFLYIIAFRLCLSLMDTATFLKMADLLEKIFDYSYDTSQQLDHMEYVFALFTIDSMALAIKIYWGLKALAKRGEPHKRSLEQYFMWSFSFWVYIIMINCVYVFSIRRAPLNLVLTFISQPLLYIFLVLPVYDMIVVIE